MCDHGGANADRRPGWPGWIFGTADEKQLKTVAAAYYDCANFAPMLNKSVLVGVGLLDLTCTPCSIYAAYNKIPGSKRIIPMAQTAHGADSAFGQGK